MMRVNYRFDTCERRLKGRATFLASRWDRQTILRAVEGKKNNHSASKEKESEDESSTCISYFHFHECHAKLFKILGEALHW